jgi:hypothetical protein
VIPGFPLLVQILDTWLNSDIEDLRSFSRTIDIPLVLDTVTGFSLVASYSSGFAQVGMNSRYDIASKSQTSFVCVWLA